MTVERTVTVGQSDPSRDRYDLNQVGKPKPTNTEPHPGMSAEGPAAIRAAPLNDPQNRLGAHADESGSPDHSMMPASPGGFLGVIWRG